MQKRLARTEESSHMRLGGIVLAGGRSVRFGAEKATATVNNHALLTWTLQALTVPCHAVAVNTAADTGAAQIAKTAGLPIVADDPAHPRGPLAGVAAGLRWAIREGLDALITLPCDTPFVRGAEVAQLAAAIDEAAAVYAATSDGPQWLCAIWKAELSADLERALAGGAHPTVGAFLSGVGARAVMFPDADRFRNVNRPSDLGPQFR